MNIIGFQKFLASQLLKNLAVFINKKAVKKNGILIVIAINVCSKESRISCCLHGFSFSWSLFELNDSGQLDLQDLFKQSFGGTKLVNGFEKSKHLEKLKLSSDTLQSLKRQNIDRKLYAKKYIYPVVDRNRPIRNTSTGLYRLTNQCRLPIENVTSGVLR